MDMATERAVKKALKELEKTIGMEDLFALGGFIEETARKIIMEEWDKALPFFADREGLSYRRNEVLRELSPIISEMITFYNDEPEKKDLYWAIMDEVETYINSIKEEEPEPDSTDYEPFQRFSILSD